MKQHFNSYGSFSYFDLFGCHGIFEVHEQMCKLSSYGLSADVIVDVLLKDTRTKKIRAASLATIVEIDRGGNKSVRKLAHY